MRFLVDQPISWLIARDLNNAGYDAVHVRDLGLSTASDRQIIDRAAGDGRVIITQDADFGTLLVAGDRTSPSVIYFRLRTGDPKVQGSLLLEHLSAIAPHLERGAIVVITEGAIRIRELRI